MKRSRTTHLLGLTALALGLVAACDSGLGNVPSQLDVADRNLRFGFDPGFPLVSPIVERDAVGATIDGQSVVFYSFVTSSPADDADGAGGLLDRDGATDTNGQNDVFLGVVVADRIDPTGFDQALAGVVRSPRCMTCHSMNAQPDTGAPASTTDYVNLVGHPLPQGDLDGDGDPDTDELGTCTACHKNVSDWRAPEPEKDFRRKTLAELAAMVGNPPDGQTPQVHFTQDPRVNWALNVGVLPDPGQCSDPLIGCDATAMTNPADDDRDGVDEPADADGVPRPVSGGKDRFTDRVTAWFHGARRTNSVDLALGDLALVSQVGGNAGAGFSEAPSVAYVAEPGPGGQVGRAYVAFHSNADNLVPGDTNLQVDVFRASLLVKRAGDGGYRLEFEGTELVSVDSLGGPANGASSRPSIGGPNAERVAFESTATDLNSGFVNNNGGGADVWVRDLTPGAEETVLASFAGANAGGNATSSRPDLSADGSAVAFESFASNLDFVGTDDNGEEDVFYVLLDSTPVSLRRASVQSGGGQATGGPSQQATIAVLDAAVGHVRVAFESDALDLTPTRPPFASTNCYLHDSAGMGTTTLLSQRRTDPLRGTLARATGVGGTDLLADTRRPHLSDDGNLVAFDTAADNLDVLRPLDDNSALDVMLVDVSDADDGIVLPIRASVGADGQSASRSSFSPILGSFGGGRFERGFVVFETLSRNIGTSDHTNDLIVFLDERQGAVADFRAARTMPVAPSVDPADLSGVAPLTVEFFDASLGTATSWLWDFGDGNTSTLENPTHTFAAAGTNDVTLTVETDLGGATTVKPGFVQPLTPLSSFAATTSTNIATGGSVSFQANSNDPGAVTSYAWRYLNAIGGEIGNDTGLNASQSFATAGNYSVELTTTWGNGASETTTSVGLVSVGGTSFDVSSNDLDMGESITFTNTSSGAPTSSTWNFGDGSATVNALTNPVVNHTYSEPGAYTATLTNNYAGQIVSENESITVYATFTRVYHRLNGDSNFNGIPDGPRCTICHDAVGSGGLMMSTQAQAYSELTSGTDAACGAYVNVGSPTLSAILRRINNSACAGGAQMFYDNDTSQANGGFSVPQAHRDEILSWIQGGAQNN